MHFFLCMSKKSCTFAVEKVKRREMSYRTVIIGLGTIARYHVAALRQSERFRLCGACDLRKEAAEEEIYRDLPFDTDYKRLLDTIRPDVAIITTPPAAHYRIAADCIARGVLPFVEKPLAANKDEWERFFVKPLRDAYIPVCHTLYGAEILWFSEHVRLQKIASIQMSLSDPYADGQGHIDARYLALGGSWLDSAPNALAPLLRLVPTLTDISVTHERDECSGLPYHSVLTARCRQTEVGIDIAWHRGINKKQTTIVADGKTIVVNHSEQEVYIDGEQVFAATGDRLTQQYLNFYRMYPERVPDEEMTRKVYGIMDYGL